MRGASGHAQYTSCSGDPKRWGRPILKLFISDQSTYYATMLFQGLHGPHASCTGTLLSASGTRYHPALTLFVESHRKDETNRASFVALRCVLAAPAYSLPKAPHARDAKVYTSQSPHSCRLHNYTAHIISGTDYSLCQENHQVSTKNQTSKSKFLGNTNPNLRTSSRTQQERGEIE